MNKEENLIEFLKEYKSKEYVAPQTICIKDMSFAENIRMAAVGINAIPFTQQKRTA